MNSLKKFAITFLSVMNLINICAGIITQVKIAKGSDFTSIIPITIELSVNQIIIVNFVVVIAILLLISIVTTYLATDIPYSPKEILSNCAGIFVVIPVAICGVAIYNAFKAELTADKLWIVLSSVFYLITNIINIGCVLTVVDDLD